MSRPWGTQSLQQTPTKFDPRDRKVNREEGTTPLFRVAVTSELKHFLQEGGGILPRFRKLMKLTGLRKLMKKSQKD